jgi:hypothetical protein
MSTIVTRAGKGSPLTNNEVDANFTNLNTNKVETLTSTDGSVTFSGTGATRDLSVAIAASTNNVVCQVRNTTGATLTKGTVVYISGATGQIPTVSKALASGDATSAQTLGMVTADIANSTNGNVTIIGLITNIDTSAYTDGAQLYLSGTTAGALTATKPSAPTHLVYVAVVEYAHATQGKVFVKVQNGYELNEIHDVAITSVADAQVLQYESASSLWKNKTLLTTNVTEGTNLYYTDARVRAAVSAGTGISYNSTTGVISSTITQYTDALARAAHSAGTGISYNSTTGVISCTITQYTDALARAAISGTAPVSYNSTTGAISMAAATSTVNGYMTSTYAAKLDGIAAGATNVTNTNQLTNGAGFITGSGNTTGSSGSIAVSGGWSVTPTGTKLYFAYNGVNKGSLDSSGNFIVVGNVTAYGTP